LSIKDKKTIVIGTRSSELARIQADIIANSLKDFFDIKIKTISTSGDKISGSLKDIGGKSLFVKEIEHALLEDEIDIAVHSLKDVPAEIPSGLEIAAITKREDPREAFLSDHCNNFFDLPKGARIGTSSPRRSSLILAKRPDLEIVPIRGNVDSRMQKMSRGLCDGLILALAGLRRLGCESSVRHVFSVDDFVPSVGQGALGIEVKKDRSDLIRILREVCNDQESELCIKAERAYLKAISGDCYTPLGACAEIVGDQIHITAYLEINKDRRLVKIKGPKESPEALGIRAAEFLVNNG